MSAYNASIPHRDHLVVGGILNIAEGAVHLGRQYHFIPDEQLVSLGTSRAASPTCSPSISRHSSRLTLIKVKSASMVLSDKELIHGETPQDASNEHSSGITSGINGTEDGTAMPAVSAPTVISNEVLHAENRSMALIELEEKEPLAAAQAGERQDTSRAATKHTSSMSLTCKQSLSYSKATNGTRTRSTSPRARAIHHELQRTASHRGFGTVTRYVILLIYMRDICICDNVCALQ
jgi:hypothetical protein